jgi:predicted nuclease with TOPRIM domain
MARESQPPPPLAIADLQDKLDNTISINSELVNANNKLQQEANALSDELENAQSMLAKMTAERAAMIETLEERNAEIKFLQQQLEDAVNEVQMLKTQQQSIITMSAENVPRSVVTPIKLVQDMKDRLKVHSFQRNNNFVF